MVVRVKLRIRSLRDKWRFPDENTIRFSEPPQYRF